ncbi:Hypothetical protein CAP_7128 [Chondromyces apiculatus DSM 436]|uniref:Uncharacterized protein n=1 Tax=Chondromyces apiculatus DSM 436 TaxID=1192034 RepID=A0A017T1U4_9BACT|nr:Hypothetical protein CAP_7128 [Chondromyces apiculatus DSM 436]
MRLSGAASGERSRRAVTETQGSNNDSREPPRSVTLLRGRGRHHPWTHAALVT